MFHSILDRFPPGSVGALLCLVLGVSLIAAVPSPDGVRRDATDGLRAGTSSGEPDPELLASFDAAWQLVRDTHFDPEMNGVDWQAVREELRPLAARATSVQELRGVIRDMLGRLGQSHFALIPGEVAGTVVPDGALDPGSPGVGRGDGRVGIDVRLVGDRVTVSEVRPGGPAWRAGIRAGWILTAVRDPEPGAREDGPRSAADLLRTIRGAVDERWVPIHLRGAVLGLVDGPSGSEVVLELIDARDRRVRRAVRRRSAEGEPMKLGHLPPLLVELERRSAELSDGGRAGIIRFNAWMVPLARRIDRAVDRYRDADGLVLDLRGNPGGVVGMISGVSGHLLEEPRVLGTMRTRQGRLQIRANPRGVGPGGRPVRPYGGPVALLVDRHSLSASEIFAAGMQELGRARVFGRPTPGGVLASTYKRLPDGDVLQYAFADFRTAAGRRLEGAGVVPDETVALTREDLLAGRDPTLRAALRWISTSETDGPDAPRLAESFHPRRLGSTRR